MTIQIKILTIQIYFYISSGFWGFGGGVFYAISSSKSIAFLGDNDKPLIWDWNGKELKQRK